MKRYLSAILIFLFSIQLLLAHQKKKVACIGDSVTKGYGLAKGKSYPDQLQSLLGEDYIVENFGRNGATLLQHGHNPYLKSEELKAALEFQPDIVVIALGLNDTDPRNWPNYQLEFRKDYHQLLSLFWQNNPAVEFYICKMTPIFSGHARFLSGTRDWYDQIQKEIVAIAKQHDIPLIDNHQTLSSRIDLFNDFLHPSEAGAAMIANHVHGHLVPKEQELSVEYPFGSHMVLQRDRKNVLKGKSNAFSEISVQLKGRTYQTQADHLGNWKVDLPPTPASGPTDIVIQAQGENLTLEDILFGDVYLASGQSNMAFPLKQSLQSKEWIEKTSNNPNIRLFKHKAIAETNNQAWTAEVLQQVNDLAYFNGTWEKPTKVHVADFSAVALSFAQDIQLKSGVPVGIIELAVGGSNTESWIPRKALEDDDLLASYIHSWKTADFIQDFCRERASVNLKNSTLKNQRHPYEPAYNYEAGMALWKDVQFKAILWYQGESNAHNLELHEHLFGTLVQSWRKELQQHVPFYVVQLSSLNRPSWPRFRESQLLLSEKLPNVHMAVSSDLGDSTDVHPRDKVPVGLRLSTLVQQHEFKKPINADAPYAVSYELKGSHRYVLKFNNCKSLSTKGNQPLKGFQIMDVYGKIVDPEAVQIEKNNIIITTAEKPTRILYAYEPFTRANLQNEMGTPASTFSIAIK